MGAGLCPLRTRVCVGFSSWPPGVQGDGCVLARVTLLTRLTIPWAQALPWTGREALGLVWGPSEAVPAPSSSAWAWAQSRRGARCPAPQST